MIKNFDLTKGALHRDRFINAVKAELTGELSRPDRPMLGCGYIRPLYRMPIFDDNSENYPIVEELWQEKLFINMYHCLPLSDDDISDIFYAFEKVYNNINELYDYQKFGWYRNED